MYKHIKMVVAFSSGFLIGAAIILICFSIYFSIAHEGKYQIIEDLIWNRN